MTNRADKMVIETTPGCECSSQTQSSFINPDTPPAPLNQSRDVRQGIIPPLSTLQYSNQALHSVTGLGNWAREIIEVDIPINMIASRAEVVEGDLLEMFNYPTKGKVVVIETFPSRYPKDALLRIMER